MWEARARADKLDIAVRRCRRNMPSTWLFTAGGNHEYESPNPLARDVGLAWFPTEALVSAISAEFLKITRETK